MPLRPFLLCALVLTGCHAEPRSNLVLVTFDTTRADHIGAYGSQQARTPGIDALAAEGTLFRRAFTSVPITAPSHATILTGKYPLAHGLRDNGLFVLHEEQETLAEILARHGYRTGAAVGSFPLSAQFGLDQGFELYDDDFAHRFVFVEEDPTPSIFFDERPAELVNEAAREWLRQVADERFFLWLHYYDPHQPHQPPQPYHDLFLHDGYSGEIAYADEAFSSVMGWLEELGVADRTVVVFTSDHGEGLGEHDEETHSMLLYDATLRVPLIIRAPGAPGGQVIEEQVGTVDIVPTVLDLLGLPGAAGVQGRSLAGSVRTGEEPEPAELYAETLSPRLAHGWGELRALLQGPFKYIHGPRPELFDLASDPRELHDLAAAEPERVAGMQRELSRLISTHAARDLPQGTRPDDETVRRLMALGYLSAGAGGDLDIVERLRSDGAPPQDHIQEINAVSRAKTFLVQGQALAAEEIFRDLLEESPDSPMYHEMLTSALIRLGRLDEARDALEALEGRDAGASEKLWPQLALAFLGAEDTEAALEVADYGLAHQPSAPLHFVRAAALRRAGDVVAAEEALRQALALDPDLVPARVDLALRLIEAGETDRAAEELEKALEIYPYDARAHYNYGRLLLDRGDYERAVRHFERAVTLSPSYLLAHYALVAVYVATGDEESARDALDRLRRQAPASPEAERAALLLEGE
ncbi:MAG: sulfatase-like hydrolase/transferase [Thermoanaerobaculia bacterium]